MKKILMSSVVTLGLLGAAAAPAFGATSTLSQNGGTGLFAAGGHCKTKHFVHSWGFRRHSGHHHRFHEERGAGGHREFGDRGFREHDREHGLHHERGGGHEEFDRDRRQRFDRERDRDRDRRDHRFGRDDDDTMGHKFGRSFVGDDDNVGRDDDDDNTVSPVSHRHREHDFGRKHDRTRDHLFDRDRDRDRERHFSERRHGGGHERDIEHRRQDLGHHWFDRDRRGGHRHHRQSEAGFGRHQAWNSRHLRITEHWCKGGHREHFPRRGVHAGGGGASHGRSVVFSLKPGK